MNKTLFTVSLLVVFAVLLFVSCSEDRALNGDNNPHPPGFGDSTSANFHGWIAACSECHGAAFATSPAAASCRQCHTRIDNPHPAGFGDSTHTNFHGRLATCESCHGNQYAAAAVSANCRHCHHVQPPATLVSCGTCHATPPVNDAGLPAGMQHGVNAAGAHEFHVFQRGYACTECHRFGYIPDGPQWNEDSTHVDALPGDLDFTGATLARARGFDAGATHLGGPGSGNASCAVYCHSNGRRADFPLPERLPNEPAPEWTAQNVTFTCTSCHSIPPQPPHPQVQTCHNCHRNVDPSSAYPHDIRFIQPQLHINGVVDF